MATKVFVGVVNWLSKRTLQISNTCQSVQPLSCPLADNISLADHFFVPVEQLEWSQLSITCPYEPKRSDTSRYLTFDAVC